MYVINHLCSKYFIILERPLSILVVCNGAQHPSCILVLTQLVTVLASSSGPPGKNSPLSRMFRTFWLSPLLKAEMFARDFCQRRWGLPARLTCKLIAVSYNLVSSLYLHPTVSQSDMKIGNQ